jgi:hypothetical protein
MATMYRIYEISAKGKQTPAGWGDHASMSDALRTIRRWGKVMALDLDEQHDSADVLLLATVTDGAVHITIEPLPADRSTWPTH